MGAALRPTHGSCRPFVVISVFSPSLFIVEVEIDTLEVGLSAILARRSCPEEIPPSVPPESFFLKP